jgi:hypothetical protein
MGSRARELLREAIRREIATYIEGPGWDAEAADKVMRLFPEVSEEVVEKDFSTVADTREQMIWTRWVVARYPAETGQYEGKPHTSPLVERSHG